jgi:hypothetical protein
MRKRIIVTDLTRFSNEDIVCTAGINIDTGGCIRPMPYLKTTECKRLKLLPGAILSGLFSTPSKLYGPHKEDMDYTNLKFEGPCTTGEFISALEVNLYNNVEEGFEIQLAYNQKHIPLDHPLDRSIITVKVDPYELKVVEDKYNPGKIKVNFTDSIGHQFRYMPITDLGFYLYAKKHHESNDLDKLNDFINSQNNIYLRIGLSRAWDNKTIEAYWMQVNGIYTFPKFHTEIRSYN